jgi:hypothetical protein
VGDCVSVLAAVTVAVSVAVDVACSVYVVVRVVVDVGIGSVSSESSEVEVVSDPVSALVPTSMSSGVPIVTESSTAHCR